MSELPFLPTAQHGATVEPLEDGALRIVTPDASWTYATIIPFWPEGRDEDAMADVVGVLADVEVEVAAGRVGLFLTRLDQDALISLEATLGPGRHKLTLKPVRADAIADALCVRTSDSGSATLVLRQLTPVLQRRFDIKDVIERAMPALLIDPGPDSLEVVAYRLTQERGTKIEPREIGGLTCSRAPVPVPFDTMWPKVRFGPLILEEQQRLTDLLSTYDHTRMNANDGYLDAAYYATYFRQSTIRVHHLLRMLDEMQARSGRVLEIGSLFGTFAVPLRRLGYEVTAVDRYRTYQGAMAGHVDYMRSMGIEVVETDRSDEQEIIAGLGQFDVVISMAVIEHVPHTPRLFLQMLADHTRAGGILALDTPNIARHANRLSLAAGLSIHQDIQAQFASGIPFEGHHREYTLAELTWMLEQVGCHDVRSRQFDYNLLQFQELTATHIEALMAMVVDPSRADTNLVAGIKG